MIHQDLAEYGQKLKTKSSKISSSDPAYQFGVYILPKMLSQFIKENLPSPFWAFEGSAGRGSWSRTPWIAIYDSRATTRASDGFFIAIVFNEAFNKIFLTIMNSSTNHINYRPFRLPVAKVNRLDGFEIGGIPRGYISPSGCGSGPSYEKSALLWKEFSLDSESIKNFDDYLLLVTKHYLRIVEQVAAELPIEKPFKENPSLIK